MDVKNESTQSNVENAFSKTCERTPADIVMTACRRADKFEAGKSMESDSVVAYAVNGTEIVL